MPLKNRVHDGEFVEFEVILFEHAHALTGALRDIAVGRLELTAENTHQRRLSGAVCSDYSVAVARGELEVDILEKHALSELDSEVIDSYHRRFLKFGCKVSDFFANGGYDESAIYAARLIWSLP